MRATLIRLVLLLFLVSTCAACATRNEPPPKHEPKKERLPPMDK